MTTLRLMTYNVRYFGHGTRGLASTAGSVHRIGAALARLDPLPDLVCLQEVETSSLRSTFLHWKQHPDETQLERVLGALGKALQGRGEHYDGHYFPAHNYRLTSRTSVYTTGLAILVRRPLALDRHNAGQPFDLTHRRPGRRARPAGSPKPWLKQTRICAHGVFQHPSGARVDLFNTHLSLPSFTSREFWRAGPKLGFGPNQLEEAKLLVDFVEKERSSDRFVVVGDFNALPGSPVYEYLTTQTGWSDPLRAELGGELPALSAFATAGFMHLRMHLDHILVGPGLSWQGMQGSQPFGDDSSPFQGLSDHIPLLGSFTL